MDEDLFSDLCLMNTKKACSKPFKKLIRATGSPNYVKNVPKPMEKVHDPGEPLSTKDAVEYLLNGKLKSSVCRYCLKIQPALSELDQVMQIAGAGAMYKVTIREMIACFYPFKATQDPNYPEKICQRCLDKAINAYLFTQQCERSERALLNCLDDIYEKLEKLDPLDRPKKRGRQKLNPNYNVLYAEHKNIIDYAEPIRNIINIQTEPLSQEPIWNEFECKKCWQVLPNMESLLNHEKIHSKHMWFNCRLCGKSFVKLNQLKKHHNRIHVQLEEVQEVDKTFKCNQCGNITENYIEHLQHIEKHKFKTLMEHIIEKKMDRLCLVCLNKSTDLVELDKMVCIHGGYPELVGDKTLYTVLASTLPDQKSYKYQELHIPHKANIMTISKRKNKKIQNIPITEVKFILSLPKVVSRDRFKTDDFYCYVFCDSATGNDFINEIDVIDSKINTIDTDSSIIVDIIDKEEIDLDKEFNHSDKVSHCKRSVDIVDTGNKIPYAGKETVYLIETDNMWNQMLPDDTKSDDVVGNCNVNSTVITNNEEQTNLLENINGKNTKNGSEDNKIISYSKEQMDIVEHCASKEKYPNDGRDIDFDENHYMNNDRGPNDSKINSSTDDQIIKSIIEETKLLLNFCNPFFINVENIKLFTNLAIDKSYTFNFSSPGYIYDKTYDEEKIDIKTIKGKIVLQDDCESIKQRSDLNWLFSKTSVKYNPLKNNKTKNMNNDIVEPTGKKNDCKLCWVFKHLERCEYCKEPIKTTGKTNTEKVKENYNVINNSLKTDIKTIMDGTVYDKNVKIHTTSKEMEKEHKAEKTWHCNVCLTNNTKDRFICLCCESKKYLKNGNCKITFGENKTFFDKPQEAENKEELNTDKESNLLFENIPPTTIEEESIMDFTVANTQDNNEIQLPNINDANAAQSMDIETEIVNYLVDTKVTFNDDQMEVEENPCIPDFNTLSMNILPYIGSNLQFNIGSKPTQQEKGARKVTRHLRNISKAFHK